MSLCVGCGLTVDENGILKADVCPNGGIGCATAAAPIDGCTSGLAVKVCPTGGIKKASPTAPGPDGCTDGLYVNFPVDADPIFPPNPDPGNPANKPSSLGCGLNTDAAGKIVVDLDDTVCDSANSNGTGAVKNGLVCDDALGLAYRFQSNIAGNSGVCGEFIDRVYDFLLPPASSSNMATPTNLGPGTYFWHTDTWLVCPDCDDPQYTWSGNTIFDMGNIFFDVAGGGRVRAVAEISQNYQGGGISFGASPPQWQIFDNRVNTGRQVFSFQSHDTTWQIVSGGQCIEFQFRLRLEVLDGSVIVGTVAGGGMWEANWHYSPHFGLNTGCRAS